MVESSMELSSQGILVLNGQLVLLVEHHDQALSLASLLPSQRIAALHRIAHVHAPHVANLAHGSAAPEATRCAGDEPDDSEASARWKGHLPALGAVGEALQGPRARGAPHLEHNAATGRGLAPQRHLLRQSRVRGSRHRVPPQDHAAGAVAVEPVPVPLQKLTQGSRWQHRERHPARAIAHHLLRGQRSQGVVQLHGGGVQVRLLIDLLLGGRGHRRRDICR
mmetsp:Transcript_23668/g.62413  ORF Transcript_23668/g.62413 Transcript_23668/m.62413 type:complete len:222 (+) Transcript_23668:44-709(+)